MVHAYTIARILTILEEGRENRNDEKETSREDKNEIITQKFEKEVKEENISISDTLIGVSAILILSCILYFFMFLI